MRYDARTGLVVSPVATDLDESDEEGARHPEPNGLGIPQRGLCGGSRGALYDDAHDHAKDGGQEEEDRAGWKLTRVETLFLEQGGEGGPSGEP